MPGENQKVKKNSGEDHDPSGLPYPTDLNRKYQARYLVSCKADLNAALAPCESPLEVTLVLALLCARDAEGRFLYLCPPRATDSKAPIAEGRAGKLYVQRGMRLDDRSIRMDISLICGGKNLAVEVDGHEYHASKNALRADKSRDRGLLAKEWIPVRFTGQEIHQAPDRCVAEVLALLGLKTTPPRVEQLMLGGMEAPRRPVHEPVQPPVLSDETRAQVRACIRELEASQNIDLHNRPFVPRPRFRPQGGT